MTLDVEPVLEKVFYRVLEEYAFMFGEVLEEPEPPEVPGPYLQAQMEFVGPFAGSIALSTPEAFCTHLAANVLGLDPDDAETGNGAADSLKELLNVICGNLLPDLAGDDPVFDLTVPRVAPLTDDAWKAAFTVSGGKGFLVEEWPVFLQVTLNSQDV